MPKLDHSKGRDLCSHSILIFLDNTVVEICMVLSTVWVAVVMAVCGPDPAPHTALWALSQWTGYVITPLYSGEAILKMIALGLWNSKNEDRKAYLRDPWCIFDLAICTAGWIDIILELFLSSNSSSANLLVLRMVRFARVFRLLQVMNRVSNMKLMIDALANCIYMSRFVYIFMLIFILFCCTLGLTWFSDELRFQCAVVSDIEDAYGNKYTLSADQLARLDRGEGWRRVTSAPLLWITPKRFCRHKSRPFSTMGRQCSEGQMCVFMEEESFGALFNFEHIGHAFLVILVTLFEFEWDEIMLALMDGASPASCIFFVLVIVFGTLFLMQYTVSMMCLAYEQTLDEKNNKKIDVTKKSDGLLLQIGLKESNTRIADLLNTSTLSGASPVKGRNAKAEHAAKTEHAAKAEHVAKAEHARSQAQNKSRASDLPHGDGSNAVNDRSLAVKSWRVDKPAVKSWRVDKPDADVRSYPFHSFPSSLNEKALANIRGRYAPAGVALNVQTGLAFMGHGLSFCFAGIIMYPGKPSEIYGAGGANFFLGVDSITFIPSHWELAVTGLSFLQVFLELAQTTSLVQDRLMDVKTGDVAEIWASQRPWYLQLFVVCFCLDALVKIVAFQGISKYWQSSLNRADFLATVLDTLSNIGWHVPNLSAFRVLRWLMMLSLSRRLSNFHTILRSMGSFQFATSSTLIVFFYVILLSIAGQQIYSGSTESPMGRIYFGDFWAAVIDIVSLFSSNTISDIMYSGMTTGPHTIIFLVCACFLLKIIVLHMMIAVMTHNFEEPEISKIQYQIFFAKAFDDPKALIWEQVDNHQAVRVLYKRAEAKLSVGQAHGMHDKSAIHLALDDLKRHRANIQKRRDAELGLFDSDQPVARNVIEKYWRYGIALREKSRFLAALKRMISHEYFELTTAAFISLTGVLSAICPPTECVFSDGVMWGLDRFFTAVFTAEMVLKMVAFGLIGHKEAYFHRGWNWLDFFVVVIMWVESLGVSNFEGLYTLRLLRIIRLFVMIDRFPQVKTAYAGIYASLEDIFYIFVCIVSCSLIFISIARQLVGGLLNSCNDTIGVSGQTTCYGFFARLEPFEDGGDAMHVLLPRAWEQTNIHFDTWADAAFATVTMFLAGEKEPLARKVAAIRGPGMQPSLSTSNHAMGLPFVIFHVISLSIFWQLITSVIIKSLRHGDGSAFRTEDQKAWRSTLRVISGSYKNFAQEHQKVFSVGADKIKRSRVFSWGVNIVISINILVMLTDSYGRDDAQRMVIQVVNTICLAVYCFEMVILFLASPWNYILSLSCMFDLVVNIISVADIINTYIAEVESGSIGVQALRVTRVLRMVRILGKHRSLVVLSFSTAKAIPKAMGVYLIWLGTLVSFGLFANRTFGSVKEGEIISDSSGFSSFQSLGSSILWLFRLTISGGLGQIAADLERVGLVCTSSSEAYPQRTDCGSALGPRLFFVLYLLIAKILLVPLITGTLVNAFFDTVDDMRSYISEEELGRFESSWRSMDPQQSGYISFWKISCFMEVLRADGSQLWFDAQREEEKMAHVRDAINRKMSEKRQELLSTEISAFDTFRLHQDPGTLPGQMRYDVVLQQLVTVKYLKKAVNMKNTAGLAKIERVSSNCFRNTQRLLIGDIQNLDASRNPDSFVLGSPFVTRNMGSYGADIGRSASDEIFGDGSYNVENGLMTSGNGMSSQAVSKKGALLRVYSKIHLQESILQEVSSKGATSLIGHRRFTFQSMLSGAKRPIEMFDFDTGWQASRDANDISDLMDSSVKHPWIAQHFAQFSVENGESVEEGRRARPILPLQASLGRMSSCATTRGSDGELSVTSHKEQALSAGTREAVVSLNLERHEEVLRAKGDFKKLNRVTDQVSRHVEMVLRMPEGSVSASMQLVPGKGGRPSNTVLITLPDDKDTERSAHSLAMSLVRQGASKNSDLSSLLPGLGEAKLCESPFIGARKHEAVRDAMRNGNDYSARGNKYAAPENPVDMLVSGIFVQVNDLLGSMMSSNKKIEADNETVPKRLVFPASDGLRQSEESVSGE